MIGLVVWLLINVFLGCVIFWLVMWLLMDINLGSVIVVRLLVNVGLSEVHILVIVGRLVVVGCVDHVRVMA